MSAASESKGAPLRLLRHRRGLRRVGLRTVSLTDTPGADSPEAWPPVARVASSVGFFSVASTRTARISAKTAIINPGTDRGATNARRGGGRRMDP
ncbi:MAG: hypothetical protein MZV70_19515 [Desulfobacterales bacterium]|nr:hypothetical protein [Desulfobacterales bacterium]